MTTEAERDALVARLRAFTPLVRGDRAAHVSRYIRADDAFHRIFFSLLRNPSLFEIYNAMDVPELMRRVLEVAPASIREVFDDHLGAHRRPAHRQRACGRRARSPQHANRVQAALAALLVEERSSRGATVAPKTA